MGRVISDLPSFSETETVANGDLLVCHNMSKAVGARDEKLPVEKLVADMVLAQANTFTNTNVFNGNVIANAPISGYRYASGSVNLNDDEIGTIPNVGDRGMMLVFTNSGSTEAALVAYRTTATNGFAAVLAQTSNIMEGIYGAGSPVFSAATDGRIAIYAGQDGVLSVINRRGGARGVRWVAFV